MKLKELFLGIEGAVFKGEHNPTVTGVSSDSRILSPGNLFIARRGRQYDGTEFISSAVDAGASAILTDLYDPFINCPQIIHQDPGKLESLLAAKMYGYPSKKLFTVGVTGSKGKTTTTYLCRHLLGKQCGLMGTIEIANGRERYDSSLTTQGAIRTQKILSQMVENGCKSAVLEVSSHALDQNRVGEIDFDVGVFTNLYPDHLDYHKTMENYALAKQKLFKRARFAIVNSDSEWSNFMQEKNRLTYGIEKNADIRPEKISDGEFSIKGVRFKNPLLGDFNLYNTLAAIAFGTFLEKSLEEMSHLLERFSGVPGRLERAASNVYVDFAHTGESLTSALLALREQTKKRLIVVFGSGGDRDPMRRFEMGRAAQKYADISILTSDNPRSEDPLKIAHEIASQYPKQPEIILDRKEAIVRAVEMATEDDIVLVAGRGHEKVQIFSNQTVNFDDVAIVKEVACV